MPLKIEREDQNAINLTPMIDIVFLLIIFFMVSTKFSELNEAERDLSINVPTISNASPLTSAPKRRLIELARDGTITLDQHQVTLDGLGNELTAAKKQYPKIGVQVRLDAESNAQQFLSVIATCKKAKITDYGFGHRQASASANLK